MVRRLLVLPERTFPDFLRSKRFPKRIAIFCYQFTV